MSSSAVFEAQYKKLNKGQKKAVDTVEGPVMVIAGPGTGKTTVLTLRIANILLKTDTAPENILAMTFTESGAYAMRRKLLDLIGPAAYKVNIHTFHGFASAMISQYPDYFPRIIGSTIITEAEQVKIIEKIIQSRSIKVLRPYGDPSYYVRKILSEIQTLKRENISPEDLKVSVIAEQIPEKASKDVSETEIEKLQKRREKNLELSFVFEKYEEELAAAKYYDFDDMLLELIRVMEKETVFKLMLQETYQYILADEHQDANASQNRILELLADFHDSPNLFIVGDDKQAIYRFQGASLDNFLYFKKKYSDAVVVDLEHNYRSHQGILDASHSVIEKNPSIPGHDLTKLKSSVDESRSITVDEFQTKNEELAYVADQIGQRIHSGEKPENIAVLFRENRDSDDIAQALRSEKIPYRIESDQNILGEVDIVKIILLCRAIHNPGDSDLLAKALLLPEMKCDSAALSELFTLARREGQSLYEAIKVSTSNRKAIPSPIMPSGELEMVKASNSKLSRKNIKTESISDSVVYEFKSEGSKLTAAADDIKSAYARIVDWSKEANLIPFPEFLQKLIQDTNLLASVVSAPNSLERLASLETFYDKVTKAAQSKKTFYLYDFIEYIKIVEEHGILEKKSHVDHLSGVRMMTAHKAKGLEFEHVYIINAIDGSWGNRTHRNLFNVPIIEHARDAGRIEDERRLFYVALTRARQNVHISYAMNNGEKESIPCQFISEIDAKLVLHKKSSFSAKHELFSKKILTPSISNAVSILNHDFVKSKFLSQPFSVTHLNNFLECPWRYFFVNLVRIPQAQSKHQMYGTAIHAALRTYFDAYKEDREFSASQLIELFKFNLDKQPMSVEEKAESFEKGKESLSGYLETYSGTWNKNIFTEYSIKGVHVELDVDGKKESLELTGKLDKIEIVKDSQVIVTDFKTSKPKSRNEIEGKTKTANGNYKRQLVFYKLLLDGAKKFSLDTAEIDFIEPNDRGIYKKEKFEIKPEEAESLKKQIEESAQQILGLEFVGNTCKDKDCSYCSLAKILTY